MTSLATYFQGWRLAFRHWRLWGLLYLINMAFAILLAFPIFQFLEDKLAHSVAIDKMYDQFDFTIYNEIMNEYGDIVGISLNQGIVTSILFLILSVFLVGGILNVLRHRDVPFRFTGFWSGCSQFFRRFLGLTILFLIIQGLVLFVFFTLFSTIVAGGLDKFHSEASIYRIGLTVLPFYIFSAIVFWMIQDYIKVIIVEKDLPLLQGIKQGFQFVFRNFLPTLFLYFLNVFTFVLAFYLYWQLPSSNAFFFAFVVGQLFLLFRIGTKLLNLGTATLWYDQNYYNHNQ